MRKVIYQTRSPAKNKLFKNAEITVALISAFAIILIACFNYFFVEKVRNDLSKQTADMELVKLEMMKFTQEQSSQLLELEKIKTEIAKNSQTTAELEASINLSRLQLDKQVAKSNKEFALTDVELRKKGEFRDKAKLANDIVVLLDSVRPSVKVGCQYLNPNSSKSKFTIKCDFNNLSNNRVHIMPKGIYFYEGSSKVELQDVVSNIDEFNPNIVLKGTQSNNWYKVALNSKGEGSKISRIRLVFVMETDRTAVEIVKNLANGYISDEVLEEAYKQNYTFEIHLDS